MKKLKILQCLVFYLPYRVGGIEVYVHSLNLCLLKKGHDVKVVVPVFPGEDAYAQEYESVPIISYAGSLNETKAEFEGVAPAKGLNNFIEILKKEKPDLVHFHQFTASNGISLFQIRAARELGIAIFFSNHLAGLTCMTGKMVYREKHICDGVMRNVRCSVCDLQKFDIKESLARGMVGAGAALSAILPDNPDSKLLLLLTYSKRIARKRKRVQTLLDLVNRFIVLTDWYYEVLKANGFDMQKVTIIRQGLPLSEGALNEMPARPSDGRLRLVFIGRIYPDKGLYILLKALEGIDESLYSLDIYGQINDEAYFSNCEELFRHKPNIRYHAFVNSKEIVNMLKQYQVLVLPSMIAEMAPLVIREAFAAGIPVVGTAIGGIQEAIIDQENGLLFEMGNFRQLKNIIERLITDSAVLKHLTSKIVPPTSFEKIADQIEQEYFTVLSSVAKG